MFTWAVNTVALGVAAWLVGDVSYDSYGALARPASCCGLSTPSSSRCWWCSASPFIVLTLGIGLFLINMGIVWLTAWLVPGFDASGFWQIAKAAIVIWFTNMLLSGFWPDDDRRGRVTTVWVRQG